MEDEKISVDVWVDTNTTVTRHGKGEWDGDDLQYDNTIKGWYRSSDGPYSIDPDEKAYAVYMVYSTGDSFHSEHGCMEVMMVNQNFEMVEKNIAAIKKACEGDGVWNIELFADDGTIVKLSNPAAGYFEHLETADYEPIDESSSGRRW